MASDPTTDLDALVAGILTHDERKLLAGGRAMLSMFPDHDGSLGMDRFAAACKLLDALRTRLAQAREQANTWHTRAEAHRTAHEATTARLAQVERERDAAVKGQRDAMGVTLERDTLRAELDRLAKRSLRLQHAVECFEGIGHVESCPRGIDEERCDAEPDRCRGQHRACDCGWTAVAAVLAEDPEASEARIDERMVAQDVAVAEAEARVRALVAALTHVRACATCSELDWAECGDGRDALALLEETR